MRFPWHPAIFLDRDGVINIRQPEHTYVTRLADFHFITGVDVALFRLARLGYPLVVVTNQPAVGYGTMTHEDLDAIHEWMLQALAERGVTIAGIYACCHTPADDCDCRKPRSGLLRMAARELDIDLAHSYMIGDSPTDVEAAWAADVPNVYLILPDDGRDVCPAEPKGDYWVVEDLASAVDAILAREGK